MDPLPVHTKVDYDCYFKQYRWMSWLGSAVDPVARKHGFTSDEAEAQHLADSCFDGPEHRQLRRA